MIIALVCPDSFKDYIAIEKEFLKNEKISKVICTTTNACNLLHDFSVKYNISREQIKISGRKEASLRKLVDTSDKVILFEYSDYDPKKVKYSRTQIALEYARKINKEIQLIEYDRSMKSATQLFKHRCDSFNHSESKWSAFAQMAFIWISKQDNKSLNIYKAQYKLNKESWLKKESILDIKNWTVENSIVEGTISEYFKAKGITDIPNLKPDLVLVNEEDRTNIKVRIIEVKTVGAGVRNNIKKYRELAQKIDELKNYTCELYYLMSYGHEDSAKDWKPLEEDDANILLWEEIFLELQKANSPLLDYITPLRDISNWQDYIDMFDYTKLSEIKYTDI